MIHYLYLYFYYRYSPEVRARIGKYASSNGVAAAVRFYSRKFGENINESSVHYMRDTYLEEFRNRNGSIVVLHEKKRGRHLLLGEDLDKRVQSYLKKVREGGGVVTAAIAIAAARGITQSYNRSRLVEFGGHVQLTRDWAYSLLSGMKFVNRKCTTAKSKLSSVVFEEVKTKFLDEVKATVLVEEIPIELILNWDQTGIKIIPSSLWTMDMCGSKRVEVVGAKDKRRITALFCCNMVGDFLPLQLIYKGKLSGVTPSIVFLQSGISLSPCRWSNEETMEYIHTIIIPYVRARRTAEEPALIIKDNFKGQVTSKVIDLRTEHNIHHCLLPPNTTDRLQPLDISVNKPAKQFLKKKFDEWYTDQIMQQIHGQDVEVELQPVDLSLPALRDLGGQWLVEMSEYISDNPQIIVNGFLKSGITQAIDEVAIVDTDLDEDDLSDEKSSDEDGMTDNDSTGGNESSDEDDNTN